MRARTLETAEFQMELKRRSNRRLPKIVSRVQRDCCPERARRRPLTLEHVVLCVGVGVGRPDDVSGWTFAAFQPASCRYVGRHPSSAYIRKKAESRRRVFRHGWDAWPCANRKPDQPHISSMLHRISGVRDAVFSTLHDVCGLKLPEAAWECLTNTTLLWLEARVRAATALTASASLSFSRR